MVNCRRPAASEANWASSPAGIAIWWVIPLFTGSLAEDLSLSRPATALAWSAALMWMGAGCALNAGDRRRRHCFLAGPIMFAGAIAVAWVGWDIVRLGSGGISLVLWTTFGLVLLSLLGELIRGRYSPPR